jgi:hypothetical protein
LEEQEFSRKTSGKYVVVEEMNYVGMNAKRYLKGR